MILDKEGKLFGKVSIIDLMVVLAVAIAIFGIYTRFFTENGSRVETVNQKIQYTMIVKGVRQGTLDALEKGGEIFDSATKDSIGTIIKTEHSTAVTYDRLQNGQIKLMEMPEKYDITVTVEMEGKSNDSGYYTSNNSAFTVGSKYLFTSKYVKTTGEVMTINEV